MDYLIPETSHVCLEADSLTLQKLIITHEKKQKKNNLDMVCPGEKKQ